MMGAWSSTLTLAVMPKLEEYKVPMLVETSSSGKITTSGNPYIFRISPTSEMEAKAFTPLRQEHRHQEGGLPRHQQRLRHWARPRSSPQMLKAKASQIGAMETMDPKATDFSAQLAKIKASGGDTLFVTTAVEQITLILKQAKDQQLTARIITTGGSNSPDQLIQQAGDAANGSFHLVFFTPWFPDAVEEPRRRQEVRRPCGTSKGHDVGGLTEGFRGWDGIYTIVEAIKVAGKAEPEAIREAMWNVQGERRQRRHRLHQAGACRQGERAERAERLPGQDRGRQGREAERKLLEQHPARRACRCHRHLDLPTALRCFLRPRAHRLWISSSSTS